MKKHQDGRHLGPWMTSTEQSSLTSIDDGGRRERSIWFKSLYLGKGLSFFPSFFFIFYSGVAQYHRLRPQDHMCLSSLLSNPCPSPSPVHPTSLPSPGKVLALCVLQLPPAFISHLLLSEPPDVLVSFSPISLFYPITLLLCSKPLMSPHCLLKDRTPSVPTTLPPTPLTTTTSLPNTLMGSPASMPLISFICSPNSQEPPFATH